MPQPSRPYIYLLPFILFALLIYVLTPHSGLHSGYPPSRHEELFTPGTDGGSEVPEEESGVEVELSEGKNEKVQVDLAVMSRCPDAHLCESVFGQVLAHPGILSKLNLTLNYIGRPSPSTSDPLGVTCMHGAPECTGNTQQLCLQSLLPHGTDSDPSSPALEWAIQMNKSPAKIGTEDHARKSLRKIGLGQYWNSISDCARGDEGKTLLLESVRRTSDVLGVSKSCTILVGGRKRCVHDGDWYDCEGGHEVQDFVRTIEEEWELLNDGFVL